MRRRQERVVQEAGEQIVVQGRIVGGMDDGESHARRDVVTLVCAAGQLRDAVLHGRMLHVRRGRRAQGRKR